MSSGMKTNLIKWSCSFFLAAMVLVASFALSQAQDKGILAAPKYRVVRVPANIVDTEYNTEGKARKPAIRPINPLDELSAEGWELVTVVHADGANIRVNGGEAHGGDFVCFLRKRESSSSLPGRH